MAKGEADKRSRRAVGFFADYRNNDATLALLRTAALCRQEARDFFIYPLLVPSGPVDPYWDRQLLPPQTQIRPHLQTCSHVVFSAPPPPKFLKYIRSLGVKIRVLASWSTFTAEHLNNFTKDDIIVAPSDEAAIWMSGFTHSQVYSVPSCDEIPFKETGPLVEEPLILIPMYGAINRFVHYTFVRLVVEILERMPTWRCLWLGRPRYWQKDGLWAFRQLRESSHRTSRLSVLTNSLSRSDILFAMAGSSLTLAPMLFDSFGQVAMDSLVYGSPVAAFDHPSLTALVRNRENGVIVPTACEYTQEGAPYCTYDSAAYLKALTQLDRDRPRWQYLRTQAQRSLIATRKHFVQRWRSFLHLS